MVNTTLNVENIALMKSCGNKWLIVFYFSFLCDSFQPEAIKIKTAIEWEIVV